MYQIKEQLIVSDLAIYEFYLPKFKIGELFLSPIRFERTASFNIFYNKLGKLVWKDFGNGKSGSATDLIMEMFDLSFKGALHKIEMDLSGQFLFFGLPPKTIIYEIKKDTDIKIKVRPFSQIDLDYWCTTEDVLKIFEIYSISDYWIDNQLFNIKNKDKCYAYHTNGKFTIYFPDRLEHKWFKNTNSSIIYGFNQLPEKGDMLIITKSLKDIVFLSYFNINAIAPQSESIVIDDTQMKSLFNRFDNIVTLFDSDSAGNNLADKYWKKYAIYGLEIPKETNCKDFSELYKNKGRNIALEYLHNMKLI